MIEDAYRGDNQRLQKLYQWYKNEYSLDRTMREASDPVGLYKLHGTLDHFNDIAAPIVLSQEGYWLWEQERDRLYNRLRDSLADYPTVFAGTALGDPHIQAYLAKDIDRRPMHYMVDPYLNQHDEQLFAARRITPIKASFEEFMIALDAAISPANRVLGSLQASTITHPVQRFFRSTTPPSPSIVSFLTDNVDLLHAGLSSSAVIPSDFYKGESQSWSPIEQGLDFERSIYSAAMLKVLAIAANSEATVDIFAIRGVAGAGKTVLLRRMAYDLAITHGHLVLFTPPRAVLNYDVLREIYEATRIRMVLAVDHAADQAKTIAEIADRFDAAGLPLTILAADTIAAWGPYLEDFGDRLAFTHTLRHMDTDEVGALLAKLEQHRSLGVLTKASEEERRAAFERVAEHQLLVALYQATQGKNLEQIVFDEYLRIPRAEAQELYLLVATLNQFRTPMRAGLVRRLTGIRFEDFEKEFLSPLSGIVQAERDPQLRDIVYRTRHPYIAEILFKNVLDTTPKQVAQYLRILEGMDPSYSSDNEAMRKMMNYRNLRELSPHISDRRRILDVAEQVTQGDPFILQQRALLEMNDSSGDLGLAERYLEIARNKRPNDVSLQHTRATLLQRQATAEGSQLERRALRGEARAILRSFDSGDGYGASSTVSLAIDEIADLMEGEPSAAKEEQIIRLVQDAEKAIRGGLAAAPDFQALHIQASELQKLFGASDRAVGILKRALTSRPELEFVAVAYAKSVQKSEPDEALRAVNASLSVKPNSRALNQMLFELMFAQSDEIRPELWLPLRRSFTNEDGNLLMHAHALRYLFASGDLPAFDKLLQSASKMQLSRRDRDRPRVRHRNPVASDGRFSGRIAFLGDTHGYVVAHGLPRDVFVKLDQSADLDLWDRLRKGDPVSFDIEFSLRGPIAPRLQRAD